MNYNYLIAGVLAIFLSVVHAIWGEKTLFPDIKKADLQELSAAGVYISWYQISITLFASGAGLIILSLPGLIQYEKPAAIFITAMTFCNFMVFLIICATKHKTVFSRTIPQTVLFVIMIVMAALGTMR